MILEQGCLKGMATLSRGGGKNNFLDNFRADL